MSPIDPVKRLDYRCKETQLETAATSREYRNVQSCSKVRQLDRDSVLFAPNPIKHVWRCTDASKQATARVDTRTYSVTEFYGDSMAIPKSHGSSHCAIADVRTSACMHSLRTDIKAGIRSELMCMANLHIILCVNSQLISSYGLCDSLVETLVTSCSMSKPGMGAAWN